MAKTFAQMAAEAMAKVSTMSPGEAQDLLPHDSQALLIGVRDAADIPVAGIVPGGINVSSGMLPVRADLELPEEFRGSCLADRSRQIIATGVLGPTAAIGALRLKAMGSPIWGSPTTHSWRAVC